MKCDTVTQVLAVVVRYFDKSTLNVVDRLLNTVAVEDRSAQGLFASLKALLENRGTVQQCVGANSAPLRFILLLLRKITP